MIYFIESIKRTDKSQADLSKEINNNFKNASIHEVVISKEEFINYIKRIKPQISSSNKMTFIHLTMHGNSEEIAFNDGIDFRETMTWEELNPIFTELYNSSKRNLSVILSSCEGFNALKLIGQGIKCPYSFLGGSFEKIKQQDAYNGLKDFYFTYFNTKGNLNAALNAANNNRPNFKFNFWSAKELFKIGIDSYKRKFVDKDVLNYFININILWINKFYENNENKNEMIQFVREEYSINGQLAKLKEFEKDFFN